MMSNDGRNYYHQQVELLLKILPFVAKESCFALKGGTAINFFVRDMPRLSVDIDLTYLPIEPRNVTLVHIEEALTRLSLAISEQYRDIVIKEKRTQNDFRLSKLFVIQKSVLIKIEPNEILRGTVYPCEKRDLSNKVEQIFQRSISDCPCCLWLTCMVEKYARHLRVSILEIYLILNCYLKMKESPMLFGKLL